MEIKVSDRLRNGAVVVAIKKRRIQENVVLCWWNGEYISWIVDEEENAYFGHYHGQNFKQAVKDFEER